MTESEIFEAVTGSGSTDFATVVRILNRRSGWCLIGGLAVNCYVEPVYTLDADIVVISSDLPAIRNELEGADFSLEVFAHSLNATMAGSDLRIQFSTDPRYQDFLNNTSRYDVLGQKVPVASLENVVRGKIWAWSGDSPRLSKGKKDELDLIRIAEKYPELRRAMPPQIIQQLEAN
ncbi:MAG TPA: hypothetical protein VJT50_05700 [Pyrinomonadaceae bacterium]|nr:hypothetical protein [Pyrinomonadaceae bacterium]